MIGFLVWLVGTLLTLKIAFEIWQIDTSVEKKLATIAWIILTSWVGLFFYYFYGRLRLAVWLSHSTG